ncbi:hypothetical protein [uncultured Aquimarina sp.]|uniref:hypothetical protein n=1 Tax=uncultured Aquimarina sp. TaxID=575652 RepID=UPI00263A1FF4|nr:hypothetical protein [uncultured Aquimarina sp.]
MIHHTLYFVFSILFLVLPSYGQDENNIPTNPQDSISNLEGVKVRGYSSTYKRFSIRAGAGFQDSFYSEIGIARHRCTYSDVGFFANDYYLSFAWNLSSNDDIFSLKTGYQINIIPLLALGLETKYQTNFSENDLVITPKIGLGIFGDIYLFYGYNVSTNNYPFLDIGKHQFSFVLNIHKNFLRYL